jgi:prepilin-type processing-associated H-X9-DG protein
MRTSTRSIAGLLGLFLVALIPITARGQALADKIPADAMFYIGWSGGDSPGPGYDQSHLKAIVSASQMGEFFQQTVPQLIDLATRSNPQNAAQIQMLVQFGATLWHYPTAIYFGGVDQTNPNAPIVKLSLLCQAGADAQNVATQVNNLLQQNPGSPFTCQVVDQLVIVSAFPFPQNPATPLSQDKDFVARLAQGVANPLIVVYLDGVAANAFGNQIAQKNGNTNWAQLSPSLGVDTLHSFTATAGFVGKDWAKQVWLEAPAPRHGSIWADESVVLDDSLLKLIPQSATQAGGAILDLDARFGMISQLAHSIDPDTGTQFDQGLAQINSMLGLDLRADLLQAFGKEWVYYIDPPSNGEGLLGMTIINHPTDPAKLEQSLIKIQNAANAMAQAAMQQQQMVLQFRDTTSGGATIHYLASPLISPAWAIKDGNLYFALFPEGVAAALNPPAGAGSILDNPAYQQVRTQLAAPDKIQSLQFTDLPKTIPSSYGTFVMISRLYLGLGDMAGAPSPALFLPTLDKFLAEAEPCGSASWIDDSGWHFKSISPFPGAGALGAGDFMVMTGIGEMSLGVSILLPSLTKARAAADRVKSASDMRQIGQAIMLYANDNKGAYPPDLGTLVKTEQITPQTFVDPTSGTAPPPANLTGDDAVNWVNANSDYEYTGAGKTSSADANTVILYEKSDNGGDGKNVLFADGHVEFMTLDAAQAAINTIPSSVTQPSQ